MAARWQHESSMEAAWQRHGSDIHGRDTAAAWYRHGRGTAAAWQWHGNGMAAAQNGNGMAATWGNSRGMQRRGNNMRAAWQQHANNMCAVLAARAKELPSAPRCLGRAASAHCLAGRSALEPPPPSRVRQRRGSPFGKRRAGVAQASLRRFSGGRWEPLARRSSAAQCLLPALLRRRSGAPPTSLRRCGGSGWLGRRCGAAAAPLWRRGGVTRASPGQLPRALWREPTRQAACLAKALVRAQLPRSLRTTDSSAIPKRDKRAPARACAARKRPEKIRRGPWLKFMLSPALATRPWAHTASVSRAEAASALMPRQATPTNALQSLAPARATSAKTHCAAVHTRPQHPTRLRTLPCAAWHLHLTSGGASPPPTSPNGCDPCRN